MSITLFENESLARRFGGWASATRASEDAYRRVFPKSLANDPLNPVWTIGGAVIGKNQAWMDFSLHYVSVMEAASSVPSILKFEVTADMVPFCKYGKSTRSLQAE